MPNPYHSYSQQYKYSKTSSRTPSSSSSYVSSSGRSSSMASSVTLSDGVKLLFLLVTTAFCCYSALTKFILPLTAGNNPARPRLVVSPDYSACSTVPANTTPQCRLDIAQAYSTAKQQCQGYITVAETCMAKGGGCGSERRNAQSCLDSQTRDVKTKWQNYSAPLPSSPSASKTSS